MRHRLLGKISRKIIDKDVYEIAASMFVSTTFGILGGFMLLSVTDKLYLLPAFLVMLPGYLELHGSIFGSFAARIATALEMKEIPKKFSVSKVISQNVTASIFLLVVVSIVLGLLAYFLTLFLFKESQLSIIFIALIASVVSMLIEFPLALIGTYYSFKKGLDPDDVLGPYITTLLDITGIASLVLVLNFI